MKKQDYLIKYLPYFILVVTLPTVLYVRIRLLAVPLERDEGEYAYMGQLLLKGIAPFTHAYTMKLPGVSVVYAFFMLVFGQTPVGIHLGLLFVNALCVYLVYLITKRLFDGNSALFAAASYAVMSLSNSVNGLFAHATHFVVLFALTGSLLLLSFTKYRRASLLFLGGLSFGLAVAMKQHAIFLFLFAAVYIIRDAWKHPPIGKKNCLAVALFLLGSATPYALIVLWMVAMGSFPNFWFWTVQYAREYAATPSLSEGWHSLSYHFGDITACQWPLWVLAASGCVLLCRTKNGCCRDRFFVFGFLLFSFLSICPGLYFRSHYFVMLLPAVAILIGAALSSAHFYLASSKAPKPAQFIALFLVFAAITYSIYQDKDSFFTLTTLEVSREIYSSNPFPEALQIGNYIKVNSTKDEKIAVLGSEPEIYFYADRLSATGHIYMYGLMENQPYAQRMQNQMIGEIEAARPTYLVICKVSTSWMKQKTSILSIFNWGQPYAEKFYDMVGVIDIIGPDITRYVWGADAKSYIPSSEYYVIVYKRRGGL